MKAGFRKLHMAAVLAASIGGGVLYASESAFSYNSAESRLSPAFVSHAAMLAESDAAFASLEFEINFVDSLLLRFGGSRNSLATESAPQQIVAQDAGLSREFWQQLDAQTKQHSELSEREDELLYGDLSSIIDGSRPGEFRAAGPLRSQYAGHGNGARSGAQTGSSLLWNAAGLVRQWTPRVSLATAAQRGIGRMLDVRAGLHLHAIRKGCISKEAQPTQSLLTDLPPPLRFSPLSFSLSLSLSLSPSFYFLRPVASFDRPAIRPFARHFWPAVPRFALIGVSL